MFAIRDMSLTINYRHIIIVFFLLTCCKKRTDIHVHVFSPYAGKPTNNATIILWETKPSNFLTDLVHNGYGPDGKVKKIAVKTTDSNGDVYFDSEKLKIQKSHNYFCKIDQSEFGKNCDCDEPAIRQLLKKGHTNDIILCEYNGGSLSVVYNNFNNFQLGDSLIVNPEWINVYDPSLQGYIPSKGPFSTPWIFLNSNQYPSSFKQIFDDCKGRLTFQIKKVKQNITTVYNSDTVRMPSSVTPEIIINW